MAPRWLFWLSYMTTFSGFHICGADLDNATNTPRSATKALNETLNLTEVLDGVDSDIPAYCNGSSSWIKFKASQIVPNCRAADFMLKSSKIWLWGHTEYEFLPRGVPARLEFPVMRTPLRVTSSSSWPCTIAIVNLNTVPAAFLNGGGTRGPYPRSDVATYYDVQDALSEVWSDCVYGIERQVGWAATGKANSLGVFMFNAQSDISNAIPNNPTDFFDPRTKNVTPWDTDI